MKSLYEENNGSYISFGDIKVPTLLTVNMDYEIGYWGQRHRVYLKENRRMIYYNLLTSGKLNSYLHDIDVKANKQYNLLVKQLAESQGITELLKTDNQLLWVQKMNNIANQAREIIYDEIIYNY